MWSVELLLTIKVIDSSIKNILITSIVHNFIPGRGLGFELDLSGWVGIYRSNRKVTIP